MKYWVVLVSKLVFFKEFFKFTVQLLYFLATLSYIYIICIRYSPWVRERKCEKSPNGFFFIKRKQFAAV